MISQRPEVLESRIAPAVFFLNGTNLTLTDSTGADQVGDIAAAANVGGATKAILLHTGDSVVFDKNGNHKLDPKTDFTMVKVTAAQAMAFFTDLNTNAANGEVGKFEADEFTGLIVGDGVKATINGHLRGSIDTLLDPNGHFTATRQFSSIASLKIAGNVDGFIQAGNNIGNITFTVPKGSTALLDVKGIDAGNSASPNPSFDGKTTVTTFFTMPAGEKGGSISGIKLPRGTEQIAAGGGGDGTSSNAGAGGDVTDVTITGRLINGIYGGIGGSVSASGAGGAGGTVSKATVTLLADTGHDATIKGGSGGGSSTAGAGGAGGGVTDTLLKSTAAHTSGLYIYGGGGGSGAGTGSGGAGGSLTNCTIVTTKFTNNGSHMFAGDGGNGAGDGGAGGSVVNGRITAGDARELVVKGGSGGNAGDVGTTGGAGGAVDRLFIKSTGHLSEGTNIYSGSGGNGGTAGAKGGDSGAVSHATVSVLTSGQRVVVRSEDAGSGGTAGANGGASGSVLDVDITVLGFCQEEVQISSGDGGTARGGGFHGGNSGTITDANIKTLGYVNNTVSVLTGNGGAGANVSNAAGGNSGAISRATIRTFGVSDEVEISSGNGGAGGNTGAGGTGGSSGDVSDASVTTGGFIGGDISVTTGKGGNGRGNSGSADGGHSGNVSKVTVVNKAGTQSLEITSGAGGTVAAPDGKGGDTGNVSKVTVTSLNEIFDDATVGSGNGGNANGTAGSGGSGGTASSITVTDAFGAAAQWEIFSGQGGNGKGTAGKLGGNGGNLNGVTFTGPKSNVAFAAGDGGNGGTDATSKGGNGGAINGIKGAAKFASFTGGDGGDGHAGTGGNGGAVTGITPFKAGGFVRLIAAGGGGSVDAGGTPGLGANISNVKITGTGFIGDFTRDFSVTNGPSSGMGGLLAGQGGAINNVFSIDRNGSISNVTATRIAAIIAGNGSLGALTTFNAVKAISGLHATFIGADADGDGSFDWNEGATTFTGFQLQDSGTDANDKALDGLLIVKLGGVTGPLPATLTSFFV